jgi:hypothetical protein
MPYRLKVSPPHAQIMDLITKQGITFPVGPNMSLFLHGLVGKANAFDALAEVATLPPYKGDYGKVMAEFAEYLKQREPAP